MSRVDIADFGGIGDGVADDTSAFHRARDAAGSDGEIIVPSGRYLVSGLVLNVRGQRWSFAHGAVLIRAAVSFDAVITVSAKGVVIFGATVDCMGIEPVSGYGWGIFVQPGAAECRLEDTHVAKSTHMGIIVSAARVTVQRCRVTSSRQVGIFAYLGYIGADADAPDIFECIVDQSGRESGDPTGGIFLRGDAGGDHRWIGGNVRGNKVFLPQDPAFPMVGIEIIHADRSCASGNSVAGGYIGVSLGGCRDAIVSGNVCYAQQQMGIEVAQSSADCIISSNIVDGVSILQDGIQISGFASPSERVTISGNSVRRIKAGKGNCIAVLNCYNITINGNKLYPSGGRAGIYSQTAASGTSLLKIGGNLITGNGTASFGILVNTPVVTLIDGNMISACGTAVEFECSTQTKLNSNIVSSNVIVACRIAIGTVLINGSTWGSSNRWVDNVGYLRGGLAANVIDVSADIVDVWGRGAPDGAVSCGPGSTYQRSDGGFSALYLKRSGFDSIGWTPI